MPHDNSYKGLKFANVIDQYMNSQKFKNLRPNSRREYRRYLMIAANPKSIGDTPVEQMRPAVIQAFLDGWDHRPGAQEKALTAIKAVEKFAMPRDLLPKQITTGCEVEGSDGGHIPWTEQQVEYAELQLSAHLSRAITLAANTGQRGSDLVRMCWTDIEIDRGRPGINVTPMKLQGQLKLWIPFTPHLIEKMKTWPRQPGPILRKPNGLPFDNRAQLADHWHRERRLHPYLNGLVLHGLRSAAVVRLQRSGASLRDITSLVGMSQQMVAHYCRFSIQRDNAHAAFDRLDGGNVVQFRERTNGGTEGE